MTVSKFFLIRKLLRGIRWHARRQRRIGESSAELVGGPRLSWAEAGLRRGRREQIVESKWLAVVKRGGSCAVVDRRAVDGSRLSWAVAGGCHGRRALIAELVMVHD